jgi:hypothetical protein
MARWIAAILALAGVTCIIGCTETTFSRTVSAPFAAKPLFLTGDPVRIGIAAPDESSDSVLNPIRWLQLEHPPWYELENQLSRKLKRPVVVEPMEPFQIAAHLRSGRIDFAWLPAVDYLEMLKDGEAGPVLALSEGGVRRGLIVTAAASHVQGIGDLKQRRFAFGPKGDPVLDLAARETLLKAGIAEADLAKELLPLPGSLQHHVSSEEAAKEIIYGLNLGNLGTAAGVIEESEYMAYAETGGRLLPLPRFSKDQFRILGRTEPLPIQSVDDGPVVAGKETDRELSAAVAAFLLALHDKHRDATHDLGVARFHAPPDGRNACLTRLCELAEGQIPRPAPE